jgi:hypothetical protein
MDDSFNIVTGNDLREGHVVYYTNPGWSPKISDAHVFSGAIDLPNEEEVVGIYVIEITGRNQPIGAREKMRAKGGPSVLYGPQEINFSI